MIIIELSTKEKGNLTELQCLTYWYSLGYKVSIPYGENSRYDFILDTGKQLLRIQVKTSHAIKTNDGFNFATSSTRINSKGSYRRSYTEDEADYFATYFNGKCYFYPVKNCPKKSKTLRFNYPKSGQKANISLAEDFEFEKVINST